MIIVGMLSEGERAHLDLHVDIIYWLANAPTLVILWLPSLYSEMHEIASSSNTNTLA
jgi:hypothetical protein